MHDLARPHAIRSCVCVWMGDHIHASMYGPR
jgi:hypothetical protein